MKKWNKRLILILVIILFTSVLGGCSKTPKVPDGFDKDLWENSVKVISIIQKTYKDDNNFSVEDEDKIEEYFDIYQGRRYDNKKEYEMIKSIQNLYKEYSGYIYSKRVFDRDGFLTIEHKDNIEQILQDLQDEYKSLTIK